MSNRKDLAGKTGKTFRNRVLFLFLMGIFLFPGSSKGETPLSLPSIPSLKNRPVIDGKMGEKEWEGALQLEYSPSAKGKTPRTKGFAGRYGGVLYYGVFAEHGSMENAANSIKKHDGSVYEDDSIEIFVDFRGRKKDYLHIIANGSGAIMDSYVDEQRRRNLSYESGAGSCGSYGKDFVYIEMAVPLSALRLGENTENAAGFGFMRYIRYNRDGKGAMNARFHNPRSWPVFRLPHTSPLILRKAEGKLMAGENTFTFSCYNRSKHLWQGKAVFGKDTRTLAIPPGKETFFTMKHSFLSGREAKALLRLLDNTGKEVLQWSKWGMVTSPFALRLKSPLIYDDEPLRLSFLLYQPAKHIPLAIEIRNAQGGTPVKKVFYPEKTPFSCEFTLKNKNNILRCHYKGETKEFRIRLLPSPWRQK